MGILDHMLAKASVLPKSQSKITSKRMFKQVLIDLLILGTLGYAFYNGYLTAYDVREWLLAVNEYISSIGFWTPDIPVLTAFNYAIIITIISYVFLVFLCAGNDGLLPLFDTGERPKRKAKQVPRIVASIYKKAKQPSNGLEEVFSRRDEELKEINNKL